MRAQIALKIYGDDTDTLRGLAEQMRSQLAGIPGLVDLTVEKQVLVPQIKVRIDHRRVAQAGLTPGEAVRMLQTLTDGARGAQIVEGAPTTFRARLAERRARGCAPVGTPW